MLAFEQETAYHMQIKREAYQMQLRLDDGSKQDVCDETEFLVRSAGRASAKDTTSCSSSSMQRRITSSLGLLLQEELLAYKDGCRGVVVRSGRRKVEAGQPWDGGGTVVVHEVLVVRRCSLPCLRELLVV